MKILIFTPSFYPAVNAGGPARSVTNLVNAISDSHSVTVVTSDRDAGAGSAYPGLSGRWKHVHGACVYYVDACSMHQMATLLRQLREDTYDVVLLNSLWNAPFSILPAMIIGAGGIRATTTVLMPRGELDPGALALKSTKKSLAGPLVRRVYARALGAVAATSDTESESLGAWFPHLPCLRVTNQPDELPARFVESDRYSLRLLFLGRVHPTKGLLQGLRALELVTETVDLTIAGPIGDKQYWSDCQKVIQRLGDKCSVEYIGPVPRATVPELLWSSDAMLMLTAGENFGHTIAEALQGGCPVIATPPTPWTVHIDTGGGEIVPDRDNPRDVAAVLNGWARKSRAERLADREYARAAFDDWTNRQPLDVISQALRLPRA